MGNTQATPATGSGDSTTRTKASRFRNFVARMGACLSPPDLLDVATLTDEMEALRQRIDQLESNAASSTSTSVPSPPPTAPGAPSPPAPPLTVPDDGKPNEDKATAGEASVDLSPTTTAVVEPDDVAPVDFSRVDGHSIQVVRPPPTSMPPQEHVQPARPEQDGAASAGDDPANALLDDSPAPLDGADGETQELAAGADRGADQSPLGPDRRISFEDVFVDVDRAAHDNDVDWVDLGRVRQIPSKANARPLTFDDVLAIIEVAVRADDAIWVDLDRDDEADGFADRVFADLIEYSNNN
ncbi:unnamed protein product (mitochondrion) [Plasmodiophora brassicae]|uniref:Uncharacterized protein n=2 Tax=Plasmodiophora brassicae TaxID=37360 RepID=A0A3P3Y7W3_PLABS|nr:unnamed protein product [Plasmodiophora brassicae]